MEGLLKRLAGCLKTLQRAIFLGELTLFSDLDFNIADPVILIHVVIKMSFRIGLYYPSSETDKKPNDNLLIRNVIEKYTNHKSHTKMISIFSAYNQIYVINKTVVRKWLN